MSNDPINLMVAGLLVVCVIRIIVNYLDAPRLRRHVETMAEQGLVQNAEGFWVRTEDASQPFIKKGEFELR